MTEPEKTKSPPLPWILLSGILGVFVGVPVTQNLGPAKKEDDKKGIVAQPSDDWRIAAKDPLKPIFDFHATHQGKWNPEEELRKGLHGYEVEFLIAGVPDPIDSPYGHAFDQVVDALQRAIEKKDGYILDRSWLPWELDKKPRPKDEKEPENLRESNPGVLLFRHGKDRRRKIDHPGLFVVFLVGETPMGGLHKRAFTKALTMMSNMGHPVEKPVRVVAPYFSGSQTSLQFIIGDWWEGAASWFRLNRMYSFDIITGNASAVRKKDFFDLDPYRDAYPNWQRDKISFSSTVIPTRTILNAMLRYLKRRDGCKAEEWITANITNRAPGKVAILTESNTGFGKTFASLGNQEDLMVLRFPLHISRVKNEFTQAFKRKDEQQGLRPSEVYVSSSFDEAQQSTEGVPSQGGQTTTAANGQVLSTILATIAREQCQYVGVVASDPRDKLFLIRLIREYCPDVRVFVSDADQLLLHPDYRYHMRGVIVGSTYPLVPTNQRWVNPDTSDRILFPSVGAQGYYNATLMHLGKHSDLLEYRPPAFVPPDTTNPVIEQRPPIWISVISPHGSLVPLQVFTNYEDSAEYLRLNPQPPTEAIVPQGLEYPGILLPIAAGLFVFWFIIIYHAWFNPSSRMFWQTAGTVGEFSLPQLCYRNILLGSQVMLAVPILALVWTHAQTNGFRATWMPLLCGATAMMAAFLLLGMVKPLCWPLHRVTQFAKWLRPQQLQNGKPELWSWAVLNILVVLAVLAFAILMASRFWNYGGSVRRTFFFVRSIDLTTGISPLVPLFLMCMGFFAWAFFQLKRNHIADRHFVPSPYPASPEDHEAFRRVDAYDAQAQEEMRHETIALRHPKTIAFLMLGLMGLGAAIWSQSLPTVEGWSWDLLFFAGFWLLFGLTATFLARLLLLWTATRRLTRTIAMIPAMNLLARLPAKVSELFGKYLFTLRPQLAHLEVQAHQLRLLVEALRNDSQAPQELGNLVATSDAIDRLLSDHLRPGVGKGQILLAERKIRSLLSGASSMCLRVLAARSRTISLDEAYGDGAKATPTTNPAWVTLAENLAGAQSIIHISQYFVQLRNLVLAAMVCSSILLLAATSYPFHPERLLVVCLMGLIGTGVAAVLYLLVDMNRDELVSRMMRTTPGKFSLDSGFVGSFLTYIVPTVGVLAAQLSGSFRWLLDPILRVMK